MTTQNKNDDQVIRIRTFWISIIVAIVLPAAAQFFVFKQNQAVLSEKLEQIAERTIENKNDISLLNDRLTTSILERTDDRFRRSDWEREEIRIDDRFTQMHQQILTLTNEMVQGRRRIEAKIDTLSENVATLKAQQESKNASDKRNN